MRKKRIHFNEFYIDARNLSGERLNAFVKRRSGICVIPESQMLLGQRGSRRLRDGANAGQRPEAGF